MKLWVNCFRLKMYKRREIMLNYKILLRNHTREFKKRLIQWWVKTLECLARADTPMETIHHTVVVNNTTSHNNNQWEWVDILSSNINNLDLLQLEANNTDNSSSNSVEELSTHKQCKHKTPNSNNNNIQVCSNNNLVAIQISSRMLSSTINTNSNISNSNTEDDGRAKYRMF